MSTARERELRRVEAVQKLQQDVEKIQQDIKEILTLLKSKSKGLFS